MKMIFNYDANKTHFHNKGFALSLVFKVRFFGTRKWPINRTRSSKYQGPRSKFSSGGAKEECVKEIFFGGGRGRGGMLVDFYSISLK